MRSIVLFQTFVNIVLGGALLVVLNQLDSKVEELAGVEVTAAHALDESQRMNETLTEILAVLRAGSAERQAVLPP